ncbi:MAG: hypothetical protein ACRDPS_08750 [Nocardioides sp.]|uniref:hypothetical protein n=1 Tax=Nocardioides sp. TaxID=35761 RepID=UPI003D6C3A14
MSAIWDGDTGHVTITATEGEAAVNLSATTSRTVIVRNVDTAIVTTLTEVPASSDLANGVVVADGGPLEVGTYHLVLRAVDATRTVTYPSPDKGPEVLVVYPALDAV